MARILFITDSDEKEKTVKSALKGKEFLVSSDEINIEDILKNTDEIKHTLQQKGYNPSIKIESTFENFNTNHKISIVINY